MAEQTGGTGLGRESYQVASEELRVGLFIFIDLPWFKHPFTLNSFRIKSEDQIRELRALGVKSFRFDPERSDAEILSQTTVSATSSLPASNEEAAGEHPAGESAALSAAMQGKSDQIRQLTEFHQRVDHVEKAFAKATAVMRNVNRNIVSRPKETLEEMGGFVDQMVTAFLEHPEVALHVMGEKCGGEEVYFHSLNCSILALMLAKSMGMAPEQGRLLGTAALLHDIGLMEIPDRVLKKSPEEFTKPERELRAMHVEYGVRIGKQIGLVPEVLAAILQHHELADGTGYPHGAKLEKITPLARILALVNFYDNICNPFDINQAMTPHEALSFMFAQRRSKFDPQALQLLIRCLGVYPPGSIVKLSNEALAMVVSVNPQKPLRPWIMLYDPSVPKEEAIMLDLEKETDIQISKSIRPALLPPPVAAYLNPRKRVTYFFDGGQPASGATA